MSETKGCLGWIAGTVGWFFLWGMCMAIGDEYKISPFTVLFLLIVATVIVAALGIYIYTSSHNRNYNKHWKRVNEIQQKYGLAYRRFLDENHIKKDYFTGNVSELSELKKISCRDDAIWEQEEKQLREEKEKRDREYKIKWEEWKKNAERIKEDYPDGLALWKETKVKKLLYPIATEPTICDAENEIRILDQHVKSERWEKSQADYTSKCYALSKEFLPNYGRYFYLIPFVKTDSDGNEVKATYKVWQFFCESMCLENDLDYSDYPSTKQNTEWLKDFRSKTRFFNTSVYEKIARYIYELSESYRTDQDSTISVIFNYDKDWGKDALDYHYNRLTEILNKEGYRDSVKIFDTHILDTFTDGESNEPNILLTDNHIVIVDIGTNNEELKQLCERIINYDKKAQPLINYISLLKAYDRAEMEKLIQIEKEKKLKLLEEKQKEDKAKKNLVEAVSSWETLLGGLHYSYLFYYYPTTCDFEATEEEWYYRRLVWDFKNTPGKTSPTGHQIALDKAVSMIKDKLISSFGADNLKYLTLVCIPASSQDKTQMRYEEFSNRICGETGIINAYPHISVISEKEEKHLGGSGIDTSKLHFDEGFFKCKYVLLFDDIITKGNSMITFKRKMEALGATVVCGISLGKTKHERPIHQYTPVIEPPRIFSTPAKSDGSPKVYDSFGKDVESIIRDEMKNKEDDDVELPF